jgi:N-acetylneuraminate synthase
MTERIGTFDFNDLFVLDMANNHQGSLDHGFRIIDAFAEVTQKHGVRAALKFQFRNLDTFIHVDHLTGSTNKHVPRFLSTRLDWDQFAQLRERVKDRGLIAMCTPFDESSVERVQEMEFDVVKVASCSARDWPLLDKVAGTGLPVIASTGGLTLDEVDDLVSFLDHRACDFALMHCVSIYPTPDEACNLGNIAGFRERYPGRVIGWSTHEPPDNLAPVAIATALGARMFERHVGVATDEIKLNAYSSTPEQADAWIAAWKRSNRIIGDKVRGEPLPQERKAIEELGRGIFAKALIPAGQPIERDAVYFSFPQTPGGLTSGDWREGIVATSDLAADGALLQSTASVPDDPDKQILKTAIHQVKGLLNEARVPLTTEFTVEYSHHYGVRNFRKVGAVLINVINREYCKKVLVQLPGQIHPWHYHKRKEETFLVLWGRIDVEVDGRHRVLERGDTCLVLPGVWHRFWTDTGCVFEEISTTHFADDSVYRDSAINSLSSKQRKTVVDHWGRFQLGDQLRAAQISND